MTDLINHSYTVVEVERMRAAVKAILFPCVWYTRESGSYPGTASQDKPEEKIELQLRTYMLAGIRPQELENLQRVRESENELRRQSLPSGRRESHK